MFCFQREMYEMRRQIAVKLRIFAEIFANIITRQRWVMSHKFTKYQEGARQLEALAATILNFA